MKPPDGGLESESAEAQQNQRDGLQEKTGEDLDQPCLPGSVGVEDHRNQKNAAGHGDRPEVAAGIANEKTSGQGEVHSVAFLQLSEISVAKRAGKRERIFP